MKHPLQSIIFSIIYVITRNNLDHPLHLYQTNDRRKKGKDNFETN